jgi:20S proteasome alpha/beta subunit
MINVSPRTVLVPHSRAMVGFVGLEGDVQSLAQNLSISISAKMGRHLGFGFSGNGNGNGNGSGALKLGRGREISPKSLSILLSHMLYSRRSSPYYVEPIVAGLEKVVNRELVVNPSEIVKDETLIHNTSSEETLSEGEGGLLSSPCYKERIDYIPFLCAQDVIGAQSKSKAFVCSGTASKSLYGTAEALWRPQLEPDELLQVCGRAFLSALERDCLSGYGAIIYLMVGGEGIMEYELACRND